MLLLGIESSCDETAAAVVEKGRRVLSNCIATQTPLHARWGGVVPEIASRAHLEQIVPIAEAALAEAGVTLSSLAGIAVTRGPGLVGSLLVGVEFAKSLAAVTGLPLLAVHHVAGHLYSPFIGREVDAWGDSVMQPGRWEPYVGLAVSGGHSSMVAVMGPGRVEPLGETLDDAVGEAYDKVAKLLGLGYPGGPLLDRLAADGNPEAFDFPRPLVHREGFDFSFSGLKTAVARQVERLGGREALAANPALVADLAASFQAAAVDVLVARAEKALRARKLRRLAVVGGVACNRGLRGALSAPAWKRFEVAIPAPEFCTDNAAMIAGAAYPLLLAGEGSDATLNAEASLDLSSPAAAWQCRSAG